MFWIDHRINLNFRDPLHVDGKKYHNNYRIPWSEEEKLIQIFKNEGWLEVQETMSTGQKSCPIEIKILGHCTGWEKVVHSVQSTTLQDEF